MSAAQPDSAPHSTASSPDSLHTVVDEAVARPAMTRQRLQSLDVYRGLIMTSLAFGGFGLARAAKLHLAERPASAWWQTVAYQFEHVEWRGCAYWDLIQPSFMFMVGVSMAYSYGRRQREGQSYARILGHAVWRAVVLVLLGIFLISNWSDSTNWSLMNVLTQIGLGYPFLFLLWGRSTRVQWVAAAAILLGTWLLYVGYGGEGVSLRSGDPESGVSAEWARQHLTGVSSAWHKNANVGQSIDHWLLNRLPGEEEYRFNRGGYQTINFIPSIATMLFGLMCGELLRSRHRHARKVLVLLVGAAAALAAGWLLDATGVCPIIKRLWTPAWVLFSTGWCLLLLAVLYLIVDVAGLRRWSFPLVVVGMNSIAIYTMSMLLKPWTARTLKAHFSQDIFLLAGPLWEPVLKATFVGLAFWCICFWMYRQKIFVKV